MTKKPIVKVGDKLAKVNESFIVYMYDNGFMFEINGQDSNGEWSTAKILCNSLDQIFELSKEAASLERNG